MPVQVSYPGVYIEEIPSGVRTITGVATSIAAFIGWTPKGPSDSAQRILSWADFERQYGGLDGRSYLGYAAYHFFANGGQQAYVVRLAATDAVAATATLGDLKLTASGPGKWAEDYKVVLKRRANDPQPHFSLNIIDIKTKATVESFNNLSMSSTDPRFVMTVVNDASTIVNAELTGNEPHQVPNDNDQGEPLAGGVDGKVLIPDDTDFHNALLGNDTNEGGVKHLDHVDLFNLLCVPGETEPTTLQGLQKICRDRRAFLLADCAADATFTNQRKGPDNALTQDDAINAAFYFPWVNAPDPLQENRSRDFPPCGFVSGLYAKTDATRGVWKAPAGTEASLTGVRGVKVPLTDKENGVLNPQAVNCIRNFAVYGTVIWGARTLQGNDERGSEWKYVPIRRTALFIEETLFRALKWVVFEPNDDPLWAQIRLNVGAFMHNLFRQGAFQGKTPREAYFVKCDKETTTQSDINLGIVNIVVGFAPLKPAEFVIIKLQQMAGQIEV
jgi:uncharacterized protein